MLLEDRLQALLAPSIEVMNFELLGIHYFPSGNGHTLRVFIDSPNGVRIEDCKRISREIDSILMVEDIVKDAYILEVTSPGLDRPLFKLADYAKFIGKAVDIKLFELKEGRRHYKAIIESVEDEQITINCDETRYILTFAEIKSANLIPAL